MSHSIDALGRAARRTPAFRYKAAALRRLAIGAARLGVEVVRPVELHNGTTLLLDARSRTEGGAFWNGRYDDDDVDFLAACFEPGSTFVDIGANVGLICLQVANAVAAPGGGGQAPSARRIVAVEPMPVNHQHLRASIEATPHRSGVSITAVQVALGEAEGTIELAGESRGSSNAGLPAAGFAGATVDVRATTLDQLLVEQSIDDVRLIKVDTEGAEVQVLRGARTCLEQMRPVVYGEFNNVMMPRLGQSFRDVVELTRPLGYRCFAFRDRLDLVEIPQPAADAGNMVLVPTERVEEVGRRVRLATRS
jgi:FkbM family methyltransferase